MQILLDIDVGVGLFAEVVHFVLLLLLVDVADLSAIDVGEVEVR
jgi:hypothetical protein